LFDDQFDGPIGMSPIRVKEMADSAIAAVHGPQDMSRLGNPRSSKLMPTCGSAAEKVCLRCSAGAQPVTGNIILRRMSAKRSIAAAA